MALFKIIPEKLSLSYRRENKDDAITLGRRLGEIVGRNDQEEFALDTKTVVKWPASISQ